jgi:hypothetical protein
MRTNIVIDDALMRLRQQGEIRAFRGRLRWDGDLEAQRLDADPETGDPPEQEQGWL